MAAAKLFKWTGAILGTLLVLILLVLFFYDFRHLKPAVNQKISEVLGREFRIDGDFRLKVLPRPKLLVEGVSLASPEWGSEPKMLSAGHAFVEVGLISLLNPPVELKRIELIDVRVLAETNSNEELNWSFTSEESAEPAPEPDAPPEPASEPPLHIASADIRNVQVIYRQPQADDMVFSVREASVADTEQKHSRILAEGDLLKWPYSLDSQVANLHTELTATIGEVRLVSEYDYPDDAVGFKLTIDTLSKLGKMLEVNDLPDERLSLQGHVSVQNDIIHMRDVQAALNGLQLALDGQFATGSGELSAKASVTGDTLTHLEKSLPALPFAVHTDLKYVNDTLDAAPFSLEFDKSRIQGNLHFENSEIPLVRLKATSELIDLTPFMDADQAEQKGETPAEKTQKKEPKRYVFEETPLPLEPLQKANAELDVQLKRVVMGPKELNNVTLLARLKDGNLEVKDAFSDQDGGEYQNRIDLKTSNNTADVFVATTVKNYKLGMLASENVPLEKVPPTSVEMRLSANGGSPRALAASLDGNVVLYQQAGYVSNSLLGRVSGDIISQLISALNPFAKEEKYTQWECSLVDVDFVSGKGEIKGFFMQSDKLLIVAGGDIDLNTEKLDFEFNTKPRKGVGVSADMFVTPFVKLGGTLAEPSVGLNKKGLLLSGGAAVLTGGMSFLYQGLMDRVTAEGDNCDQVGEAVKAFDREAGEPAKAGD